MVGRSLHPRTRDHEARRFFPGAAFNVSVKQNAADEGALTVVDVSSKDINASLPVPTAAPTPSCPKLKMAI
jgi:hypothetical protein